MSDSCPCGSGKPYQQCCSPFHQGIAKPRTAEQLMRSRYSAYALRLPRYLLDTLHPSKRSPHELTQLEQAVARGHWLGLRIISCRGGQVGDSSGYVAFRAHFEDSGTQSTLEENSRFVQEQDRWYYIDGVFPPHPLPARNEPCWCDSGKKFKKCHGLG